MPAATTWLRGSRKEWSIVLIVFVLVMGCVSLYAYPVYYEFDAPGEMIPVEEIGIKGSVHFVTVYSGVTENWIERYLEEWSMEEGTRFYRLDSYYDSYAANLDEMSDYREETIEHAFEAVVGKLDQASAVDYYREKLADVLSDTSNFYGDSMGLMVAIGLHEEIYELDFSVEGRYKIAGTGTIEEDMSVGSIGALEQKLILAEREGVTHFFVPKDREWYGEDGNEAEAEQVASDRGLSMDIIPVATLDDALAVLYSLQQSAAKEVNG